MSFAPPRLLVVLTCNPPLAKLSLPPSPKEYALLELLMRNAGQPVSRAAILEQVWKIDIDNMTNVVDVYINYLRRKVDFGYERALIQTIRGVGYQIGETARPS